MQFRERAARRSTGGCTARALSGPARMLLSWWRRALVSIACHCRCDIPRREGLASEPDRLPCLVSAPAPPTKAEGRWAFLLTLPAPGMSPVAASMPHAPEMARGDTAPAPLFAPLKQGMQQPSLDVSSLFSQEGTARQQGVLRWVGAAAAAAACSLRAVLPTLAWLIACRKLLSPTTPAPVQFGLAKGLTSILEPPPPRNLAPPPVCAAIWPTPPCRRPSLLTLLTSGRCRASLRASLASWPSAPASPRPRCSRWWACSCSWRAAAQSTSQT